MPEAKSLRQRGGNAQPARASTIPVIGVECISPAASGEGMPEAKSLCQRRGNAQPRIPQISRAPNLLQTALQSASTAPLVENCYGWRIIPPSEASLQALTCATDLAVCLRSKNKPRNLIPRLQGLPDLT